jgi:hypothetical protein
MAFDIELVLNIPKTCAMLFHFSYRKYADKPNIMLQEYVYSI